MTHPQQKLLEVMVKEAFDCFKRGDHEDGKALLYSFFDKFDPTILQETAKDKKFIYELIKANRETLEEIKNNEFFKELALVKQSRLSVMEIGIKYWKKICKIGKMNLY